MVVGIVGKHIPRARVDEVAQDAFVAGFRSLGSFSQTGPFDHWLAKIAVRCCYDYWRKHFRKKEVPVSNLSPEAQDWMDNLLAVQSNETFKDEAAAAEAIEVIVCRTHMELLAFRDLMRPDRERIIQQSIDSMKAELSPGSSKNSICFAKKSRRAGLRAG